MKRATTVAAIMLGIVLVGIAIFYWITPASSLPHFMPGYDAAMSAVHVKHGLLAFGLAILLFIYAWFASGPKKSH